MNLREAAKMALEALLLSTPKPRQSDDDYAEQGWKEHKAAITALRAALADTQDWNEIEALRASLREHMAEIHRLNECLTWEQHRAEHVGTHGPGCAEWGPKHYECLLREHEALKRRIESTKMGEPVAYVTGYRDGFCVINPVEHVVFPTGMALHQPPPKRKPLTNDEIRQVVDRIDGVTVSESVTFRLFARAIERAHGIGGEE